MTLEINNKHFVFVQECRLLQKNLRIKRHRYQIWKYIELYCNVKESGVQYLFV